MAKLWDQRDINAIHQVFHALAPDSIAQRADMLVELAHKDLISLNDLEWAIHRRRISNDAS